jgi:hypothetical protein
MPLRFRFSIGQLMGLIALSALLTANAMSVSQGNFTFYSLIAAAMGCVGLGVLLYNRGLSSWMWVWIAGEAGPLLLLAVRALAFMLLPWLYYDGFSQIAIQTTLSLACSFLTIMGFAMTLREIRRKLAIYENRP